jgi:hypothetical protein
MSDSDPAPCILGAYRCIWVSINKSELRRFQCQLDILHASLVIPKLDQVLIQQIYDGPVPSFPDVTAPIIERVLDLEGFNNASPLSNQTLVCTTANMTSSPLSLSGSAGNAVHHISSTGSLIILFVPNGSICMPAQLNRAGMNFLRHVLAFTLDGRKGKSAVVGLAFLKHFDVSSLLSLSAPLVSLESTIPICFNEAGGYRPKSKCGT